MRLNSCMLHTHNWQGIHLTSKTYLTIMNLFRMVGGKFFIVTSLFWQVNTSFQESRPTSFKLQTFNTKAPWYRCLKCSLLHRAQDLLSSMPHFGKHYHKLSDQLTMFILLYPSPPFSAFVMVTLGYRNCSYLRCSLSTPTCFTISSNILALLNRFLPFFLPKLSIYSF